MKQPTEAEFRKYWKGQSKESVIDQLWDMYLHCEDLGQEIGELNQQVSRSNARYLGNCRSVGGVTLPPGV